MRIVRFGCYFLNDKQETILTKKHISSDLFFCVDQTLIFGGIKIFAILFRYATKNPFRMFVMTFRNQPTWTLRKDTTIQRDSGFPIYRTSQLTSRRKEMELTRWPEQYSTNAMFGWNRQILIVLILLQRRNIEWQYRWMHVALVQLWIEWQWKESIVFSSTNRFPHLKQSRRKFFKVFSFSSFDVPMTNPVKATPRVAQESRNRPRTKNA